MNSPNPSISVDSLRKSVGHAQVLRDVSLSIRGGEIVGLIGPNGAGKTTLIRCLAGIYATPVGTISISGYSVGTGQARQETALMPEEPDLYPGLSVIEHVRFVQRLNGVFDSDQMAETLMRRYSLSHHIDALPHELSQGMKRKLALIMALVKGSNVLLFDEPFNGMDPSSARTFREELANLRGKHKAILVAMHGLADLQRIADRIVVLSEGRIVRSIVLTEDQLNDPHALEDLYQSVFGEAHVHDGGEA